MTESNVEKIMNIRKLCTPAEVDKLGKLIKISPRSIALALIVKDDGRILVDQGFDAKKNEKFYRLLGGGVDFGEMSAEAVVREINEETGIDVRSHQRIAVFENVFTFNGDKFHEVMFVHDVSFVNPSDYLRPHVLVNDTYRKPTTAVWRSLSEIKAEEAKLYPEGMETLLLGRGLGNR